MPFVISQGQRFLGGGFPVVLYDTGDQVGSHGLVVWVIYHAFHPLFVLEAGSGCYHVPLVGDLQICAASQQQQGHQSGENHTGLALASTQ